MKTIAFKNLGCKVNAYETEAMVQMLKKDGYQIVEFEEIADVYLINTCTVTNIADRKSRQMLHQAKKRNPEAVVVAAGCYVQTGEQQLLEDASVDLIIGNNKKKEFVSILNRFIEEKRARNEQETADAKTLDGTTVIDIGHTKEYEEMTLENTDEHTRVYIKIQDGCNQFCAYCLIPYARGRVRSREEDSIIHEIKGLVQKGFQEVVLTGIHISSYGCDFEGAVKDENGFAPDAFAHLIREIDKIEGLERIRLGSLEPRIITESFLEQLKQVDKLCPHFHLSLQSGCNKTLKAMNRHYTTEQFAQKVAMLREAFNHPAITTDVIVGFPGETEEDFENTRKFLEEIHFFEMHVFKYSVRNGTLAAKMKEQVPEQIKEKRSNVLLEMEKRQSKEFRAFYLGQEVTALIEEQKNINGKEYWIGHTAEYVKVATISDEDLENQLVNGIATEMLSDEILYLPNIEL